MQEKYNGYALITGAVGGIGEAVCNQLAKDGYDLVICDYPSSQIKEQAIKQCNKLEKKYGIKTFAAFADVRSYQQCTQMINTIIENMGENCAIVVTSAGIALNSPYHYNKDSDLDDVIDTNLKGTAYITHLMLPLMMKQQYGCIVTISSVAGMYFIGTPIFVAANSGIIGLTKSLARDYARWNIRCNTVAPGATITQMSLNFGDEEIERHRQNTPLKTMGLPEDMAEAVSYCISARFLTGEIISPNGGLRQYTYLYQQE